MTAVRAEIKWIFNFFLNFLVKFSVGDVFFCSYFYCIKDNFGNFKGNSKKWQSAIVGNFCWFRILFMLISDYELIIIINVAQFYYTESSWLVEVEPGVNHNHQSVFWYGHKTVL